MRYFVFSLLLLLVACSTPQPLSEAAQSDLRQELNTFIDDWHANAATADTAFFYQMAKDGIYIGTDKHEHWTRDAFYEWAKPFFKSGKAWAFTARNRHLYFSKDYQYAWFDELLDTWMGVCRGSGVLHLEEGSWKLAHYHLSVTVPNAAMEDFIELQKKYALEEK